MNGLEGVDSQNGADRWFRAQTVEKVPKGTFSPNIRPARVRHKA